MKRVQDIAYAVLMLGLGIFAFPASPVVCKQVFATTPEMADTASRSSVSHVPIRLSQNLSMREIIQQQKTRQYQQNQKLQHEQRQRRKKLEALQKKALVKQKALDEKKVKDQERALRNQEAQQRLQLSRQRAQADRERRDLRVSKRIQEQDRIDLLRTQRTILDKPERDLRTRLQEQNLRQRFLEKKQSHFQKLLEEDRKNQIWVRRRSVEQQVQRQLLNEQLRNKPVVTQSAPR